MTCWPRSCYRARMLDYSNGNSFGTGREPRHPVPPWKFGLRLSDDRGGI